MVIPIVLGLGLFSLLVAFMYARQVANVKIEDGASSPDEVKRLKEISEAIAEGAMAFLRREYTVLGGFMLAFALIILLVIK
ncbi:MAG: sodium/proton-translocating pyrophosphatase, partial [Candidatus Kapabacteria bacterium]|nr:sodium/proton-translocating pyrophosphatase [Candidatus Kapabacteria bacterium]